MSRSPSETDTFDAARRRLCPDGACVGLLDEAGRCKECGRTASGEAAAEPPMIDPDEVTLEPEEPAEAAREADDDGGAFDSRRKLCPDGACLGVLGEDGRCKVCGQGG